MTQRKIHILGHDMLLTADEDSLTGCRWLKNDENDDNYENDENIENAIREIREYLEGTRKEFSVKLRPSGTDFRMKVWEELRRIPYGDTITYAELARRIGRPTACRAVANACGANPCPIIIPCHRVVASGGRPGGYTGPPGIKQALLDLEKPNDRE